MTPRRHNRSTRAARYRWALLLVTMGVAACATVAPRTARGATEVYLFAGQSNMTPEIRNAFVAEMQSLDPSQTFATSFYSFSGRGLDSGWDNQAWLGDPPGPGRSTFYPGTDDTDANIGVAYSGMIAQWQSDLAAITGPYTIRGIVWVQGEQDTKHQISAERYAASLAALNARLHEDLGLDEGAASFLFSELLSSAAHFPFADEVRNQQATADAVANAVLVDTSGLAFTDGVHYDASSRTELGQRFAAAAHAEAALAPTPAASAAGVALVGLALVPRRRI